MICEKCGNTTIDRRDRCENKRDEFMKYLEVAAPFNVIEKNLC